MPKNKYEDFIKLAESLKDDAVKFYEKGNASAGTRLRKGLMDLKNLASDIRKNVQEQKNKNKKTKNR